MKALMIVTLMSGLTAEPAVMPSMEACLKAAPPIAEQVAVSSAACVPHTPKDTHKSFREMMAMFLDLIDTIEAKNFNDVVSENERKADDRTLCSITDILKEDFCGSFGSDGDGFGFHDSAPSS